MGSARRAGAASTTSAPDRGLIGVDARGGCWAERVVVPAERAHALPSEVDARLGALVEPLAVAWHAVRGSRIGAGGSASVTGAGPIGIGVLLALRAQGVERVFVSEPAPARRALAARLGATTTDPLSADPVQVVMEGTDGAGADAAFEAAGAGRESFLASIATVRAGGVATQVATYHGRELPMIDPAHLLVTEKVVTGSFCYTAEDFRAVIDAMASGAMPIAEMITAEIALEDTVAAGIEPLLADGRDTHVKILLSPRR